jgi:carbonic anhydrase
VEPQAVHQNVEQSLRRLSPIPDLRKSLKGGSIRIVGAVHDMHTGKVALK